MELTLTAKKGGKGKVYALPTALKKKDGGVPKLTALRDKRAQAAPYTKGKVSWAYGFELTDSQRRHLRLELDQSPRWQELRIMPGTPTLRP